MKPQPLNWHTIRCLILDIDGICTDGKLYYDQQGEALKVFHVHDGHGLKQLREHQIHIAIISGRTHPAVTQRFHSLGVEHIFQGHTDKLKPYAQLLNTLQLKDEHIAYMGDDLPDLPLIQRAKIGITVPHAIEAVRASADWITHAPGGHGAVREVCDLILARSAA